MFIEIEHITLTQNAVLVQEILSCILKIVSITTLIMLSFKSAYSIFDALAKKCGFLLEGLGLESGTKSGRRCKTYTR